jgi:AmmeMemoRadiSam system protein B
MEEELYLSKPDIILIISPHGSYFHDAFTVNVCPEFETDLKEFGDLSTKMKFKGEMHLSANITHLAKDENLKVSMVTEKGLDHGSIVPLFALCQHLPQIQVLQVGFCDADYKTHLDFGYFLKEVIMNSNKRVAVIASGDLSHSLTTESPAGFNPNGQKFDLKIQELLSHNNVSGMLGLDEELIKNASECGFRSLLILMGILKNVDYSYKQYAYEAPFGVGYLTAHLVF